MNEPGKTLALVLQQQMGLPLNGQEQDDAAKASLYAFIDHLIDKDFERLVLLLYRIDVPEAKLKTLLQQYPASDASVIIGNLIVERLEQKEKARKEHSQRANDISDEERW